MMRHAAVVLLLLLGLVVASQPTLACAGLSAHHCCEGAGGGTGHPDPCDPPATLPDLACPQASCGATLNPALGETPQVRQQLERLEFRPLDLAPASPGSLTSPVGEAVDPAPVPRAATLKPETLLAAPAAYLHTLRLRL